MLIRAVIAIAIAVIAFLPSMARAATGCDKGGVEYICSVFNVEDMLAIPESDWIVISRVHVVPTDPKSGLFVMDYKTEEARPLIRPGQLNYEYDAKSYPTCPGPLDLEKFSPHGINLLKSANGSYTLYVVSHQPREAIEIFDIRTTQGWPAVAWKGCVPLPAGSRGNGVSGIPGGGVAVGIWTAREYFPNTVNIEAPDLAGSIKPGQKTGHIALWTAKDGWSKLPGSEAAGPNGIEVSSDGRWAWIANWGDFEVVGHDLKGNSKPVVVKLDFRPDNLRWGADGKLWVGGQRGDLAQYFKCWGRPGCRLESAAGVIDFESRTFTAVPHTEAFQNFNGSTVALRLKHDVLIGGIPNDHIVRIVMDK